jgi:hypothetical protein
VLYERTLTMTAAALPTQDLYVQTSPAKFEFCEDELIEHFEGTATEFYKGHFCGIAPESIQVGRTGFPWPTENGYHMFSDSELRSAWEHVIRRQLGDDLDRYSPDIRGVICGMSLELNARQRWAPRFRAYPPLPMNPSSEKQLQYLVDLQVIDLHWRACSSQRPRGQVDGYPNLFDGEQWGLSNAVRFAERELPFAMKLQDARLANSMCIEHVALQTPELRDKWRLLQKGRVRGSVIDQYGMPQLEAKLQEAMIGEPHLRKYVPGLVRTWAAYQLVGRKPVQIARLVGLMTGDDAVDASAIRRKLSSLEERTGWSLK